MIVVIVPILALLALGYTFSFEPKKWTKHLLSICLIVESILSLGVRFINGEGITLGMKEPAETYEADITNREYINWIEQRDTGFYRILNDEITAENYNIPLAKVYPSVSYYYGVYNPSIDIYNEERITGDWFIPYLPSKFMSQSVYGCKYLIANYEWSYIPFGFTEIARDTNGVRIFENTLDMGLGYATNQTYNFEHSQNLPKALQEFIMLNGILTKDAKTEWKESTLFKKIHQQELQEYVLKDNWVPVNNEEKGILFIDYSKELPASACNYKIQRKDEIVDDWNFNEYGYHAMNLDEKTDGVYLDCHNAYFDPQVVPASIYYINESDLQSVYQELQEKDQIELIEKKGSHIRARITIHEENAYVATTIPYDKGWTVKANGQEVPTEMVNLSFLGFQLEPGTYELEFTFIPQGLKLGALVSVVSLLLYFVLLKFKK